MTYSRIKEGDIKHYLTGNNLKNKFKYIFINIKNW